MSESTQCCSCLAHEKSLRVQRADYQFELKKVREDQSTQKALYEIHLQKEVRRWQEQYKKIKALSEYENRNWIDKLDQTVSDYQQRMDEQALQLTHKSACEIENLRKSSAQQYQTMVRDYEHKLSSMAQHHSKQLKDQQQTHKQRTQELIEEYQRMIVTLRTSHSNAMSELKTRLESQILGACSEKNKEKQLHEKTKQVHQKAKQMLYESMADLKKTIGDLQTTIRTLEGDLNTRNIQVEKQRLQRDRLETEHQQTLCQLEQENRQQLANMQQNYKEQVEKIYKDSLKGCSEYELAIKKIEQVRVTEKQVYLQNVEEMQKVIESRPSRAGDLREIQELRSRLASKTRDCDAMSEEMKWYRLELENKEETYNKIFVPLNVNNENLVGKRKDFKLRRQGRSVTTVREILMSLGGNGNTEKRGQVPPLHKQKLL